MNSRGWWPSLGTGNEPRGEGWMTHTGHPPGPLAGLVAAGLLLVVGATSSARAGDWLLATLLLVALAALGALFLGRDPRPRPLRLYAERTDPIDPPAPGTSTGVLVPARPHRWATLTGFAVLGLLIAGWGCGLGVEGLAGGSLRRASASLIPLGLGLLFVVAAAAGAKVRRSPQRGLLLRPDAIVVRTEVRPVAVPWDSITRVRAHWTRSKGDRGPRTRSDVVNWLSLETLPARTRAESTGAALLARTTAPTVDVDGLAADRHDVLAVCEFYRTHPERRPELDTELGLRTVATWEPPRS